MSLHTLVSKTWNGRRLVIKQVTPEERAAMIRDAIAKRAFQDREILGSRPGHELKEWRQAESEILAPLNCGFMVVDHGIELSADAVSFGEGEIEICVEPRHLTIRGKDGRPVPEAVADPADRSIVRTIELPIEIDPSEATAWFRGRMIQMELPKPCAIPKLAAAS